MAVTRRALRAARPGATGVPSWVATALGACIMAGAGPAVAQGDRRVDPSAAELAIAVGRLDLAEEALYERARRWPREPSARGELGAFLASRGRFLVGATLLEEARYFGGDSASIERRLFEVYRWAGQYARAAALQAAPLAAPERDAFQRAGAAVASGADSSVVSLTPNELQGLGRVRITVAGIELDADISATVSGLLVPATVRTFSAVTAVGARGDTTLAVATLAIGAVTLGPVPLRLAPGVAVARVGLDVLGQLMPTFDAARRTLVVRAVPVQVTGRRLPILLGFPGVTFVATAGTGPVALHAAGGRAALRGARWTLDVNGGAIMVEDPPAR